MELASVNSSEDPEEQRRRIEATIACQNLGFVIGIVIGLIRAAEQNPDKPPVQIKSVRNESNQQDETTEQTEQSTVQEVTEQTEEIEEQPIEEQTM